MQIAQYQIAIMNPFLFEILIFSFCVFYDQLQKNNSLIWLKSIEIPIFHLPVISQTFGL